MKSSFIVFLAAVACVALMCGEISAQRGRNCQAFCPTVSNPICAVSARGERRTFANGCQLGVYNCENPRNAYRRLRRGPC